MPGFLKILRIWLTDTIDYLGLVIIASLIFCGIALVALIGVAAISGGNLFLLAAGFSFVFILILSPCIAGIFSLSKRVASHEEVSIRDLFGGIREYLFPSWALGLAQVTISIIILTSIWFYLTRSNIALRALGTTFIYVFILWLMSALYHYPILIEQRPGILKVLKRAFLIALDNIAFTAGLFLVIILLTCLCAVTLVGMAILYPGMACLLQTEALRALFVKYELL